LQVSDHTHIVVYNGECLRLLELVDNHHLEGLLFKLNVLIVVFVSQELGEGVVGGGEHQLALVVGVGEDTLGDSAVVLVLIEEKLVGVRGSLGRDDQEVEVIEHCFLAGTPVIIVEVVINPEETLVKHLWHKRLFEST
jgi:hypothetical protein